jgi:betaine lipid synthase
LAKIPYYVWVGAQKDLDPNTSIRVPLFALDGKELDDNDPTPTSDNEYDDEALQYEGEAVSDLNSKLFSDVQSQLVSSDHIHGQGQRWRLPFDIKLLDRFSTYIYAFAWEDPKVDLIYLDLQKDDQMFVITSGGCNVLEYAIKVGPKRIHCVDLNPCQNHMLELKLAGLSALVYEDVCYF